MRRTNTLIVIALALLAMATASCDKGRLGRDTGLNAGKGVGMMFRTPSSTSFFETKAAAAPVLNKVYGSEDDGFVIEEYVSDIEDVMRTPETKGTEWIQNPEGTRENNFVQENRQFQVMAFLDTTKTVSGVEETYHINEFNYPAKYDGSKWNWVLNGDDAPCWRTSTKYSIWSYWPEDSEVTVGTRSAVSVPNWTSGTYNTVSFTHTVPKALEDQQDLLFAYNEETRDFAHIDGDDKKNYVYAGKEQAWIDNEGNDTQIFDNKNGNPKTRNIDIHFYHALAAVKFEISDATTVPEGTNIHSITLCYVDGGNIVTSNAGIATSGSCTATGNPASTGDKVTFAWTNQGNRKPLHYEYSDAYSNPADQSTIAGGYASTGKGVMFMIPQTANNLTLIVQFSRYGGSDYYTRVYKNLIDVNWQAGKYYKYKIEIGEFHVPGELMALNNIEIPGLMPKGSNTGFLRPETTGMPTKGVTKVGMVIDAYGLGKKSDQTVYLNGVKDGVDAVPMKTVQKIQSPVSPPQKICDFNFANVGMTAKANTGGKIFEFGLNDSNTEEYFSYYSFTTNCTSAPTLSTLSNPSLRTTKYYVFDTTDAEKFQVIFKPSAGDMSGAFVAEIRCMIILEVEEDPSLPGNFNTIDWNTI